MRRRGATATAAAIAAIAAVAPAGAAADPTPAENHAHARQRSIDQLAHPDFTAREVPAGVRILVDGDPELNWMTDPYRLDWACDTSGAPAGCRGRSQDVFFANRYGARLHGRLFGPRQSSRRRRPAVVLLTGNGTPERPYWSLAQGLAEAGYIVLAVEAQGEGRSEATPPDPDPSTPDNEYCRPGNWDGWQDRVEMGIREQGDCAGVDPDTGDPTGGLAGLLYEVATHDTDWDAIAASYRLLRARETFAAVDALDWLLSDGNPWRRDVDARRIALAGHSGGGHGALWAGNADRRVRAVVAFDQHGRLENGIRPRVPTMFQMADQEELGPKRSAPDPESLPGFTGMQEFAAAGVPSMVVTLGGSTHQEWNFVPFHIVLALAPYATPFLTSSRDGERVGLYYAQAWLDRWLGDGRRRRSGLRRLRARTFDASVDRSSIGQGVWDPAAQANVPYTIAGEAVRDHLSAFYRSAASLRGLRCDDVRAGC